MLSLLVAIYGALMHGGSESANSGWLEGCGQMGELVGAFDWSKTPLGPLEAWPQSLRLTVATILHSRHPMFLLWGPELIQIYNDAYVPSFGDGKHPLALGQRGQDCWTEAWGTIGPQIEDVRLRGKSCWFEDALVPIYRNGGVEHVYWTYGYSPVYDETDAVAGVLVICTETTARVLSQRSAHAAERRAEQLRESEARLRALAEERSVLLTQSEADRGRAEDANRAKDEFLAMASHELRNPLNAILGWARLLQTHSLDARASVRAIETIERNATSQLRLIEDLLDGSRIIVGKLRLEAAPIDLAQLASAALDSIGPSAAAKNITLKAELATPARLVGDPERLQQVVWNLCNNAIKFTPKGGTVWLRLECRESDIQLVVADDGIGIEPEFLPFVFERFRQAESSTTRRHGGLGLGLALVRHLVEAHGGTVHVESAGAGRGATFTVRLPLQTALPAALGSQS